MFAVQSMWPELHSVPDAIVWHQQLLKKIENTEGRGWYKFSCAEGQFWVQVNT